MTVKGTKIPTWAGVVGAVLAVIGCAVTINIGDYNTVSSEDSNSVNIDGSLIK